MERVKIETSLREQTGKGGARKIRVEGNVPAVVYGKDIVTSVTVTPASLRPLRAVNFSESTIIDMEITGGKKKESASVLVKDVQYHPLTEKVIHIDFMKVSLEEKITVHVPLALKGEPAGVKEGAIVEQILWEVEIEGLPLDIPQKIEVDISNLEVGHSLHASDIEVAGNLKLITPADETLVTMLAKREEEVVEEAPAEEGPAPEPEVIKEKKEDEAKSEKE